MADAQASVGGWKKRSLAAADKMAERQNAFGERRQAFDALNALGHANAEVSTAEERLARLRAELQANETRLKGYVDWSLRSGSAHPQAMTVTFAIAQAPAIIAQAESNLAAARDRLAVAQNHHDQVMAEMAEQHDHAEPLQDEPEAEAPAASATKKGKRQ